MLISCANIFRWFILCWLVIFYCFYLSNELSILIGLFWDNHSGSSYYMIPILLAQFFLISGECFLLLQKTVQMLAWGYAWKMQISLLLSNQKQGGGQIVRWLKLYLSPLWSYSYCRIKRIGLLELFFCCHFLGYLKTIG